MCRRAQERAESRGEMEGCDQQPSYSEPPAPTQVQNITTSLILGGWWGWWSGPGLGLAVSVTSGQGVYKASARKVFV